MKELFKVYTWRLFAMPLLVLLLTIVSILFAIWEPDKNAGIKETLRNGLEMFTDLWEGPR